MQPIKTMQERHRAQELAEMACQAIQNGHEIKVLRPGTAELPKVARLQQRR